MNLLKQFTIGQRRALAFATEQHVQLDDKTSIQLIKSLQSRNIQEADTQAMLSFLILLTAYRYYAFSDRLLNKVNKPEGTEEFHLNKLDDTLNALADTLNFYDQIQIETELPTNDLASVQDLTNRLFAIFAQNFSDQLPALEQHWGKAMPLLAAFSRDEKIYEPSFSPTHIEFMEAVDKTQCIFAATGKYWGADEWNTDKSLADNIKHFSEGFFKFMTIAKKEAFKGFAVRFPAQYSETLDTLAKTVAQFLQTMNQFDPAKSDCLQQNITQPGWKFTWANESMFLTAFGTCYPEKHPRNPYGFGQTYFFFQPDFVLRKHPGLTDGREAQSRERIAQNFERNDMAFSNEGKSLEVQRYIRPMKAEEPAVNWWQYIQ